VGLIDLTAGAEYLVQELSTAGERPVEVVIMARAPQAELVAAAPTPATTPATVAFEREVSVAQMPALAAHVLDGRAVLPMAIIIEWLAHGALHGNPGLAFCGLNDLRIFKGVVLDTHTSHSVRVLTHPARTEAEGLVVPVELASLVQGKTILHARAEIVLSAKLPKAQALLAGLQLPTDHRPKAALYGAAALFHGPAFQGLEQLEGCGPHGISAHVQAAPAPKEWLLQPLRNAWLTDPLVLDGSFQMMILWSLAQRHSPSLPCAAAKYRQFKNRFPKEGARVVIQITSSAEHRATADIEYLDAKGQLIARIEGYECVIDDSLTAAFQRNQLAP
jgi:hypothetical protein